MRQTAVLEISAVNSQSPEAESLLAGLWREIAARGEFVSDDSARNRSDSADLPRSVFLIGRIKRRPVACGAIGQHDQTVAEIARLYVMPNWRGQGHASQILAALEGEARRFGYLALRAEAGDQQTEAIRLLESGGYRRVPASERDVDNSRRVYFEKRLDRPVNFSIFTAEERHAGAIADIYNEAIRTTTATFDTKPKTVEDRLLWLREHDSKHPAYVAIVDDGVVGWAALTSWSDRAAYDDTVESSFYVAEEFRGRGIGRALKETLIAEARRLGFHTIIARVAEGSAASIHLNESLGFRHMGTMREVGFKFGRRLDVHIMQLFLLCVTPRQQTAIDSLPTGDQVCAEVLREASKVLDHCLERISHCLDQLSLEQVWWRPEEDMNSIGNLILHLTGNIRQWIVAGLGMQTDTRDRSKEFSQRDVIAKDQLLQQLSETVRQAQRALAELPATAMSAERRIQGFELTGWEALFDTIPHFKGHTQEIISLTRMQLRRAYQFHWQPTTPEQGAL